MGGQSFDLNAIASNMAALRQTQTSIREDLKRLQTSNELLWKEAYDARAKHRTHEETMNLIVSFLERLFGTEGEGLKGLKEALNALALVKSDFIFKIIASLSLKTLGSL